MLTRRLDTTGARWVHHALFVVTYSATLAAASSVAWSGRRAGWAHVVALVPLSAIPYAGTRGRRHVVIGASVAPPVVAGLIAAWRR